MRLVPRSPDAAAFAPFGTLIEGPAQQGERRHYSDWLPPVQGLALQFHINAVGPSTLPLTLAQVEQHPHAAQVFVPVDVARYVVTVMPSRGDGLPDPAKALSMILPGTTGVIYGAGVWHAGVTVLDRPAQFAVLMYRGAVDDDVFVPIAPLHIEPALVAQNGLHP
jgi:ureidoglycolate lyase